MTSNNKSKISEAAQEVLNQFKQRIKHKKVSEFIQQCAATFAETDDKLIRELGVQSFLSLAPVFAPWYNDKSEQFGREVWGQNCVQAFNSTSELNCNDLSWQLPAQPPTDISLKPATELELNRSNMGNNVSEAKELQSYRVVCQQIQQLFNNKLRGDAPKREQRKERKQSKNPKKPKKLKLSAESLEASQHRKPKRGRQMNLNQIKELKQFEQKRVIKIRLFPDRKFSITCTYGSKLKEDEISLAQSFKDKLDNLSESLSSGSIDGHSFAIQKFVIWNDWKQSCCKVVPTAAGIRQAHRKFSAFVSNLHNRICNFLLRQYDLIILPEFQTNKMVRRKRKRLGLPRLIGDDIDEAQCGNKQAPPGITLHKTTRKNLLAFSHYKFRHKLIAMSQSDYHLMGKRVIITTEEFTSKQHPFKDVLHPQLGGERLFVLDDFSGLRDNVGAYNVMSRSFTKGEVILDTGGGILHVQHQTLYKKHIQSLRTC
ncbi:hypothetical protein MP228_010227 [Amoeboaphelidium protococcarum]|nr:hypothetical protein MP228_010227 [Amoeboaphelidium protococcarum]